MHGHALELASNWHLNGFVAQSGLYSDGNNYFGDSRNSLSADFFEAGLVSSAYFGDHWSISAQVASRKAGSNNNGSPDLDYAFVRYRVPTSGGFATGFRLGRIQLDQGLYNATRDVPFTRPSVLLPQSLYGENIRNSRFAHDGIQWYGEQLFELDRLRWSIDYYKPISDGNETNDIFVAPVPGEVDGEWSWSANVVYEWDDGQGSVGLGYDKWRNSYSLEASDIARFVDDFGSGTIVSALTTSAIDSLNLTDAEKAAVQGLIGSINAQSLEELIDAVTALFPGVNVAGYVASFNTSGDADITSQTLSAEYSWPHISIAAEYLWREIGTRGFDLSFINATFNQRGYYLQAVWHISEYWDLMLRFDDFVYDNGDRSGHDINQLVPGVPLHRAYARDATLGLTWHISNDWMARAEWHNIEGTAWVPVADNDNNLPQEEYWNLVALQLAWRF